MGSTPNSLEGIRKALARHRPAALAVDRPQAAVALLLTEGACGPEVLFILRAPHDQDPWSGNIGFPGGRVAPGEDDPRRTAERETREELTLELGRCEYLGRLDDLYGLTLPILVSCFVYATGDRPVLAPNHEVSRAFWYCLDELCRPERHRIETFPWRGEPTTQPVVALLGPGEPLLWGITYRLLRNFFDIVGIAFSAAAPLPSSQSTLEWESAPAGIPAKVRPPMEQRRFRRIPFETEVLVAVDNRSWNCALLDLALQGALLESAMPFPLPLGTTVGLALPLPGSSITLDFDAELIHREGNRLGFKFLHENLETLTHLRTLLELNTGDPEGVRSELLTWLKG